MINFTQLVLASHNAGKLRELQAMLGGSVQLRSIGEFSQVEPEETGLSFVENAILKARNAARISGLPALADDSGLAVDFLGGAPGIYSARYADGKGDAANNAKLLDALKDVPEAERGAQFVCVLALVRHADDPLPILCEGLWHGRILTEASGEHGFGYDPLFWVPERNCSSAELGPVEKESTEPPRPRHGPAASTPGPAMIDDTPAPLIHGGVQTPRAPLPVLPPLALYVHIPWCVRKCPYCDFNSHTASPQLPEEEYVDALLADLDQDLHAVHGRPLSSIFFSAAAPRACSAPKPWGDCSRVWKRGYRSPRTLKSPWKPTPAPSSRKKIRRLPGLGHQSPVHRYPEFPAGQARGPGPDPQRRRGGARRRHGSPGRFRQFQPGPDAWAARPVPGRRLERPAPGHRLEADAFVLVPADAGAEYGVLEPAADIARRRHAVGHPGSRASLAGRTRLRPIRSLGLRPTRPGGAA
nr:hypothetical protein GCM10020185_38450 [Pseudomonas brassicacearum subsp. brassicacearum]